jgi:hypothetical protein
VFLHQSRTTTTILILLNILLAIPLPIYIAGLPYTRLAYDDLCSAIVSREYGPIRAVSWWYNNMNGRFVAFFINSATTIVGAPIAPLVTLVFLVLWWVALFSIIRQWLKLRPYAGLQAALVTSFILVATLSSLSYLATILYWYTGTSMYLSAAALFTAFTWLVFQSRVRHGQWHIILCASLPFLVSGVSDIGGFVQTFILGTIALIGVARRGAIPHYWLPRIGAGLFGALLGLIIVLLSPGNAFRAALFPKPSLNFMLAVAASSLGAPAIVSFHNSPLAILTAMSVSAVAGYYVPYQSTAKHRRQTRITILVSFAVVLTLIALCFSPVAYFLSTGLVEHAWILPMYIMVVGLSFIAYACGHVLHREPRSTPRAWKIALCILLVAFAMTTTQRASDTVYQQRLYAEAWDERDSRIKTMVASGQGSPAVGPLINPYTAPPAYVNVQPLVVDSLRQYSPFKWEITGDPGTLSNQCLARYYHVAAVVADPSKEPQ